MMTHELRPILIAAAAAVALVLAPALVGAQVRYKDNEGVWHWVDSMDEVPERYRAGAAGKPVAPPPPSPNRPESTSPNRPESTAGAKPINRAVVSGRLGFACDYKSQIMEARGYTYLREGRNGPYVTNIFAAGHARIVVRDEEGKVVGVTDSKGDGSFSVEVVDRPFYELTVSFHGRVARQTTAQDKASNMELMLGRFEPREVDNW